MLSSSIRWRPNSTPSVRWCFWGGVETRRSSCRSSRTANKVRLCVGPCLRVRPFLFTAAAACYAVFPSSRALSLSMLSLLSRDYCHLCDDMLKALQIFQSNHDFQIEVVDIDSNEALLSKYDQLVPVLLGSKDGGPSKQLCHYFLDESALLAFFEQ